MTALFAFQTENSYYMIDCDKSQVMRVKGVNPPTPRQAADAEWQHVELVTPPIPGLPVVFDWKGDGKTTITSPVQAAMLMEETDEGTLMDIAWLDEDDEIRTMSITSPDAVEPSVLALAQLMGV